MRPNLLIVAVAFLLGCAVLLALVLADKQTPDYDRVETTNETTSTLPASFDRFLWGKAEAEHEAEQQATRAAKAAVRKKRMQTAGKPMPGGPAYPTDELLLALARCETGGKMDNPNTGNGYYGFFQNDRATWAEAGQTGVASDYSYEHQRDVTRAFILKVGWGRWPKCSRVIGAR